MFDFITISDGLAVIQHAPSGSVYRFRPVRPGVWSKLTLERIEGHDADHASDARTVGALAFAQGAAEECCRAATIEVFGPPAASTFRSLFPRRPRRYPAPS